MDVARGRSRFVGRATRGDDKPRGRGRGRRNAKMIDHDGELEMSRYIFLSSLIGQLQYKE